MTCDRLLWCLKLCAVTVVLLVTVEGKELLHGDQVRLPDNAAGAEAAEVGINCPSLTDKFRSSSSVKCDGCHVIAVALVYRVVRKREIFDEATDTLCNDMMHSVLRQKTNGRRFWVPPHKSGLADHDIAETDKKLLESDEKTITLTGMDPRFGNLVTYHDEWEQRVLPCAPYLLKRMCFERMGEHEEGVELCYNAIRKTAPGKMIKPDTPEEEKLLECVSAALGCEDGDCLERRVLEERKKERVRFLKFEGAYGNEKAPYVEDEFQPGMMEKNPYGPGGNLEKRNEVRKKMLKEQRMRANGGIDPDEF
jgi:hypothetical protein